MTTIGLDLDGTLSNWIEYALKRAKFLWDIEISVDEVTNYNTFNVIKDKIRLIHNKDPETIWPTVNFNNLCPKGCFYELNPYPNMETAVRKLSNIGDIYIVTKLIEWQNSPYEKIEWLKKYLYREKYSTIMVQNDKDKGLLQLDYMIDDNPEVIQSLQIGTIGIMVERPWNKKFIRESKTPYVMRISDLADKILEIERQHK